MQHAIKFNETNFLARSCADGVAGNSLPKDMHLGMHVYGLVGISEVLKRGKNMLHVKLDK